MMESWDPAVVLLFKAIGYLLLSTVLVRQPPLAV
jgi:hypothetical protein